MKPLQQIEAKIMDWAQARNQVQTWQTEGQKIVFTNGCFDLLHYGHLHYLAEARGLGDKLVLGLNSAASVSRLKGPHRPINDEMTRTWQMAALGFVDLVVVFSEDTPLLLIEAIQPDVLVKGGDYAPESIVGAEVVLQKGGQVLTLPFIEGYSTTRIESKIRDNG
jgi:D-glycero-beta-D-manno-heptose 1-phosphate adenylyltransferase